MCQDAVHGHYDKLPINTGGTHVPGCCAHDHSENMQSSSGGTHVPGCYADHFEKLTALDGHMCQDAVQVTSKSCRDSTGGTHVPGCYANHFEKLTVLEGHMCGCRAASKSCRTALEHTLEEHMCQDAAQITLKSCRTKWPVGFGLVWVWLASFWFGLGLVWLGWVGWGSGSGSGSRK